MKVYVAGPLNGTDGFAYLKNLARMYQVALQIHRLGHAVFIPGADVLLALLHGDFGPEDAYDRSLEWLRVSDCIFVIAPSPHVNLEIDEAKRLGKPIYTELEELI